MGVRDLGCLEYVADRIRRMVSEGAPPSEVAATAMHLIVAEHPFWDANHRTGFETADVILRAFGLKIVAPRDEIERYVRAIDRQGIGKVQIAAWIRRRAEPLR